METALAALIIVTIVLFGVLTIAHAFLTAQDAILTSWKEMEARLGERSRTELVAIRTEVKNAGAIIEITLRNTGAVKLADFDQWDVIVQYYTASATYEIDWLSYTELSDPGNNQWTVVGIYLDAAGAVPEVYEPGILNPGEEIILRARVSPALGPGSTNLATVAVANGISVGTIFTN